MWLISQLLFWSSAGIRLLFLWSVEPLWQAVWADVRKAGKRKQRNPLSQSENWVRALLSMPKELLEPSHVDISEEMPQKMCKLYKENIDLWLTVFAFYTLNTIKRTLLIHMLTSHSVIPTTGLGVVLHQYWLNASSRTQEDLEAKVWWHTDTVNQLNSSCHSHKRAGRGTSAVCTSNPGASRASTRQTLVCRSYYCE